MPSFIALPIFALIFGEEISVHAEVTYLPGKSGHADKQGLINWVTAFKTKPSMVFVNHGEDEVCASYAKLLHDEYGLETFAPYSGTSYDLAKGEFVEITQGIPVSFAKYSEIRIQAIPCLIQKALISSSGLERVRPLALG